MSWLLLVYFVGFVLQAALMGISMFTVSFACMSEQRQCQATLHGHMTCDITTVRHMPSSKLPAPYWRHPHGSSHRLFLWPQLIKLSDLENDFINPHDATNSINTWVVSSRPQHATHVQTVIT